jgi:hypothetical protein
MSTMHKANGQMAISRRKRGCIRDLEGVARNSLVVVPNSARVAGLTALAAPSSTTCVFAARLADASSPS